MYEFNKRIEAEMENIRRLKDYYADDFDRIACMGHRGSLYLRRGNNKTEVILQREIGHRGSTRQRERISLGSMDSRAAIEFARDDYLNGLNRLLNNDERMLKMLCRGYRPYDIDSVLGSVSAASRAIIDRAGRYGFLRDEAHFRKAFASSAARPDDGKMPTAQAMKPGNCIAASGRRVRSKGEVIIDILLDQFGVPHDHEKKIVLFDENGYKVTRAPDFTLYCDEEIHWEHFGMVDNDDYLSANARKIQLYNLNDIVLWKNLIVTMDGPGGTVNAEAMAWIIRSFVLPRLPR